MRKTASVFVLFFFLIVNVIGCNGTDIQAQTSETNTIQNTPNSLEDDFYQYVNQKTIDGWEIPDDSSEMSWFYQLTDENYKRLDQLVKDVAENREDYADGTTKQRVADLYLTAVDYANRDENKFGPTVTHFFQDLEQAESISSFFNVLDEISNQTGLYSLYTLMYLEDALDSHQYSLYFLGGDTGLSKEVWLSEDAYGQQVRKAYETYIVSLFQTMGAAPVDAQKKTQMCMKMMKDFALASLGQQELYNPQNTYHPYGWDEFFKIMTNLDQEKLRRNYHIEGTPEIIIYQEELSKKINGYLTEEHLEECKAYAQFVLMNDTALYASTDLMELKQKMNQVVNGANKITEKDKMASSIVQSVLGFDCGKLYVDQYFSEESKKMVQEMIDEIIAAYEEKIEGLDWMSDETKSYAIKKLETMDIKIGYPDIWPKDLEDGQSVKITSVEDGGLFIENILAVFKKKRDYQWQQGSKEVDRTVWAMTPQEVNAYYNPNANEIVFPAGILQAPYFDPKASKAQNLGGIGAVIAHEISHAFDSNGAQYDAEGNLKQWWTEEDYAEFERKTQKVIDYYNTFKVLPGYYTNGELTISENIADLGAISCITYLLGDDIEALKEAYTQWATIWASKSTEEYTKLLLKTDVHAPNKVRVNGVLKATDQFYEVFDIKEGDGMYESPENRPKIW
ncbi:MAG: M13 family metallopeptidase [Clostridiales bacterium]|nr:M13 family metallopeptidase [Clostridiales bacterium]